MLWRAEVSWSMGWDLSQCWVREWCLLQQPLLACVFQIQEFEFIQPPLHQHGPAAKYMTGSLTGTTPEIFWAKSDSGAVHWPPLASAVLYGAGENNSWGFWNDLPVMLSHFRACNRFWIYSSTAWFPPCKIAVSAFCYVTRHLEYKLERNTC